MADYVLVLTTMPDDGRAEELARTLVGERLAACVNVHAPMASTYRWEGAIQRDAERPLTIKTTAARLEALKARLHELHPYEVPEFLVIPVAGGGEAYLRWLDASTQHPAPST